MSPLQLALLSGVRSLVGPKDLDLDDGLVLRREREAWHGGLGAAHPRGRCPHEASPGQQTPAVVRGREREGGRKGG